MGNSHSQPTSNVDPASALHPRRTVKHHKSTPHSLRLLCARESSSISRSPSPSFNSFSEKYYEREKENQHPSRTGGPPVRLSPPPAATSVQSLSNPVHAHVLLLPSPTAGLLPTPPSRGFTSESDSAYIRFLHDYPQYASSWHVDALRRSEYSRLGPNETYVDYMGGALYPASLISVHAEFLQSAVLGNTHSESPRSASESF
jgi:molybdenum cofactor sulfurtransferase